MKNIDYRLLGRDSQAWQKKYFFREIGRGGNPDSVFMLLLLSGRLRSAESSGALGSGLYAKLVGQYGQKHLSDSSRDMVRRLVDTVNAEAAEAKKSRIELTAGFLHFKGLKAAAGSVGRLRAGFTDGETLVATSSMPEHARQKGDGGQVSLDLGQTVEGNLTETPAFFIVPSGAMATGEELLRRFVWDFVSDEGEMRDRAPEGWEHLPCLVGASATVAVRGARGPKKKRTAAVSKKRPAGTAPASGLPGAGAATGAATHSSVGRRRRVGFGLSSLRPALWVVTVAVLAFLAIKYVFSGSDRHGASTSTPVTFAPAGFVEEDNRAEETVGTSEEVSVEVEPTEAAAEQEEERKTAASTIAPRAIWRSDLGGVITSSAVDLGQDVAFGSRDGSVYCLSKESGTVKWRYGGPDGFGSSPVAADGKIYIGCYDGGVLCLNARDGAKLWSYSTGGRVVSSPALAPGGNVLIGSYDGFLYCLTPDGKLKWRFNSGARIWSSPACSGEKVFFGDLEGRLHCLTAADGRAIWSKTAPGAIYSSPAADMGRVIFGSSDGTVTAYSQIDGSRRWFHKGPSEVTSSIGMISESVVVGFKDGRLARLESSSGIVLWEVGLPGAVRSRPVALESGIAVSCYDGHVRVLNISSGSTLADYAAGGKIFATPLVSSGIAYFGDMTGKFTALDFTASARQ